MHNLKYSLMIFILGLYPREEFRLEQNPHWQPPHMHQAKIDLVKFLSDVDLVLEARDARAPLTTAQHELHRPVIAGPSFSKIEIVKKRIVILNKVDLVTPSMAAKSRDLIESFGFPCVSVSAFLNKQINHVVNAMIENVQIKYKSL